MADNSSSNTASVAIVILVIIAIIAAVWFFTQGGFGGGDRDINAGFRQTIDEPNQKGLRGPGNAHDQQPIGRRISHSVPAIQKMSIT